MFSTAKVFKEVGYSLSETDQVINQVKLAQVQDFEIRRDKKQISALVKSLNQLINDEPNNLVLRQWKILLLIKMGRYNRAVESYEEIKSDVQFKNMINLFHKNMGDVPQLMLFDALCWERIGRKRDAFRVYKVLNQHYPNFWEGYLYHAWYLLENRHHKGNVKEAIKLIEKVIAHQHEPDGPSKYQLNKANDLLASVTDQQNDNNNVYQSNYSNKRVSN